VFAQFKIILIMMREQFQVVIPSRFCEGYAFRHAQKIQTADSSQKRSE
jgi:hypothetical protein